jgi:hypothetical protein
MRVHLHTVSWNERRMLDFFFRHYDPWVDAFFVHDDNSTDGTREILERHPKVTVAPLVRVHADSWVRSEQQIYDQSWKQSVGVADWIVAVNIDEHLYHPDIGGYLAGCATAGITAIPALGYQMVTAHWPNPDSVLWRDYPEGAPSAQMSKIGIFDPNRIAETGFGPGRHQAHLTGEVRLPERDELLNLHYKYLGIDETLARHRELLTGLRETDIRKNWGHKYRWDRETLAADIDRTYRARVNVHAITDHHTSHGKPRWWRPSGGRGRPGATRDARPPLFAIGRSLGAAYNSLAALIPHRRIRQRAQHRDNDRDDQHGRPDLPGADDRRPVGGLEDADDGERH